MRLIGGQPVGAAVVLLGVLLLGSACAVDEQAEVCPIGTYDQVQAYIATLPTLEPVPEAVTNVQLPVENHQVLVAIDTIPAELTVQELIDDPSRYLSARAIPDRFVCESTVNTVATLQTMAGREFAVDVRAGQFLDGRQFQPVGS